MCASSALALDPPITYEAEVSGSVSGGKHTPFWLAANKQGLGSVLKNTGYVRAAAFRDALTDKKFGWGFGADIAGSWRAEAPFQIRQLYADVRYRDFMLTVGAKCLTDTARLVNPRLSSGDLLFSGNAMPVPEVKISMPDYLDIPGLRHWLGFKAYLSFGRFTDQRWERSFVPATATYNRNVISHTKGLLLRIGPADKPFVFEGGLEMAAQFGGELMRDGKVIASYPHGIKDYFKIIFPTKGGSDSPETDQLNVLGNQVGEWSARLTWKPKGRSWSLAAYYIHYFEDHSMMFFDYPWKDGLFGLEYRNHSGRWLTGAVYEFLSTTDQAGPVYWDHTPEIPEQVSGLDNYYNHSLYHGWQNWGMGIGNPLIISPVYNASHLLRFTCNRIRSHHWGVEGQPAAEFSYRALVTYTRGWGTYDNPYPNVKKNLNVLAELTYTPAKLTGWSATLGIGADFGTILGRSYGASLSIKKTGLLTR